VTYGGFPLIGFVLIGVAIVVVGGLIAFWLTRKGPADRGT
jgi:hypothetical protein